EFAFQDRLVTAQPAADVDRAHVGFVQGRQQDDETTERFRVGGLLDLVRYSKSGFGRIGRCEGIAPQEKWLEFRILVTIAHSQLRQHCSKVANTRSKQCSAEQLF